MKKNRPLALFVAIGLGTGIMTAVGSLSAKTTPVIHNITLHNPNFEYPTANGQKNQGPARWFYYGNIPQGKSSVGITKQAGRSGTQALEFRAAAANAVEGYWQRLRAQYNALETVGFSAYIKSDPHSPLSGSARALLGVEFHLPGGQWLNQRYLTIPPSALSTTHWKKFTVRVSPLQNISGGSIHFVVSMFTGASPSGTFFVDDASAKVEVHHLSANSNAAIHNIALHNPNFEYPTANGQKNQSPARWLYYGSIPQSQSSVGITKKTARSGAQSLEFRALAANAVEGYWQRFPTPYNAMETVVFSAYVKSDPDSPLSGSARAMLGVEFHLPGGHWLNQLYLRLPPSALSTTHWKKFTVRVSPLKDIHGGSVHFVVSMTTGKSPGGAFYVDGTSANVRVHHSLK